MSLEKPINRRSFLRTAAALTASSLLPLRLVEVCWGQDKGEKFTFGVISDSHLTQIKGTKFVKNFDKGLEQAVAEVGLAFPEPDFIVFGGDLAQLGKREEIDHGLEMLAKIQLPIRFVMGEHDYYLDLGQYWEEKLGKPYYSFDHKGIHFVTLNSILTHEEWIKRWPTPMDRMRAMARLDNPQGSPFMVGKEQIQWLTGDLSKVGHDTPLIIFSHSPLYKVFKPWNFWTDDAEAVQAVLSPFKQVNVFHGHVHQILYNQIGSISFQAWMSTAWPWPYPVSYSKKPNMVPNQTVFMNRADPFHERDATGWSQITVDAGRASQHFDLWENASRIVRFDEKVGHPADDQYQDPSKRIPPQTHY